jgi:hypothetical protein
VYPPGCEACLKAALFHWEVEGLGRLEQDSLADH